jgi:deoxyhypusine synthase
MENEVNDQTKINDTRKQELLANVVEHIDIKSFDARPIIDAMKKMSFSSRDTGRAADIYNQMLATGIARWRSWWRARPRPAAAWTSMRSW